MSHRCHAPGCEREIPPRLMACREHWYALRKDIRDAIWREYRTGQEITKTPTRRYMAVQRLACAMLAFTPFSEEAAQKSAGLLADAIEWRKRAISAGDGDPLEGLVAA